MSKYLEFRSYGLHQIQRTFFPDLEHEAGPIPKTLVELSHISRDSTAVEAREKPIKKGHAVETIPQPVKRKGRPRKGEESPIKEPTRVQRQMSMTLEDMMKELPTFCNVGSKKNSQGYIETWIGYKLHTYF